MTSRVAVLVDGDNIPANFSPDISSVAKGFGRIDVTRVYADASRAPRWAEECGFRLVHAGSGKNASDILLVIDAMEMALTHRIEVFVVASSDGDFTHLVQRLRELGRVTVGIGEAKAPARFRACCTEFRQIGSPPECAVTDMDRKIRAIIAAHSQNGMGIALKTLGPNMHAQHGIRVSSRPERTWRVYLAARTKLYDLDSPGPEARVRFLPKEFSACAAD